MCLLEPPVQPYKMKPSLIISISRNTHSSVNYTYLIKNIPCRYKKRWSRTKTGLAKKDVKSNRWPMPPGFDRFESFGHDELTAKYYFRCSRPPDVDGIEIIDKDDQVAKH